MKLSKQKQRLFAQTEVEMRYGHYEGENEEREQIDEYIEYYKTEDDAAHAIATLMFDGYFQVGSIKKLQSFEKLYGKKIWELAKNKYVLRHHDT